MLDTLAVAREMTAGGIDRDQAETIANAMRKVAEQGDHVTSDQFKAGLAEVRTEIAEVRAEIANLDTRLSAQIGDVRTEVANLDTRLSTQIAGVRTEVARRPQSCGSCPGRPVRALVGPKVRPHPAPSGCRRIRQNSVVSSSFTSQN